MALGVMGYLAHRHGDVVGLVSGDTKETRSLPAKGGEAHLERLLRHVHASATVDSAASRLEDQLEHVARTVKGRFLLFVVTDEITATPSLAGLLRRLRAQHEILWLTVRDAELAIGGDWYSVHDSTPLPGHLAGSAGVAAAYARAVTDRDARRQDMLRQAGIAEGSVSGSQDVMTELFALLERHRRAG